MNARAIGAAVGLIVRTFENDLRACGRVLASAPVLLLGMVAAGRFKWEGSQDYIGWCAAIAAVCLAVALARWLGNGRILHGLKLCAASTGLFVAVVLFLQYAVDTAEKLARHAFIEHGEIGALAVCAALYVACKISLHEMETENVR